MDQYRISNNSTGEVETCTIAGGIATIIVAAADGTELNRTTIEVPLEPPAPLGGEAELLDRAEAARRSAYDAVMAAGPRSMSRLEDADQAGSEAFRSVLRGEA